MAKKTQQNATETVVASEKATKGSKKTANPTAEKTPRTRKDGLRSFQVKILRALNGAKNPLTRKQIAEKAKINSQPQINIHGIGTRDPQARAAMEKKSGIITLTTLKYVKESEIEVAGRTVHGYSITAAGKAALAKAEK